MNTRYVAAVMGAVWLFGTAAQAAGVEVYRYFEDVRGTAYAPEQHGVRVTSVRTTSPAKRAGLQEGDMIIGLDGLRIRDRREYDLVCFLYDQRPTLELTIVRGGKIVNITIRGSKLARSAGSFTNQQSDDFLKTLEAWRISLKELLGHEPVRLEQEKETGAVDGLLEQFDAQAQSSLCITPEIAALRAFPARGREAISLLAKRNAAGDREWVADLLKVYHHLLWERYDDAAKLIASRKLEAKRVDPFLNRLVEFYKALTVNRVSAETGVPLDKYQVDIPFFALCYPYPLTPEKRTNSFASDPQFQKLFDKATSGRGDLYGNELRQIASQYEEKKEGSEVDKYLNLVRAAVLCPNVEMVKVAVNVEPKSGEWKQSMVAALLERLEKKPEDQVITALALIYPTCKGDQDVFRKAHEIAFKAGSREAALANQLAELVMQLHNSRIVPVRRMIQDSEACLPKPAFYQQLQRTSPIFDFRASGGCFRVRFGSLEDLSSYCFDYPYVVAKALDEPLDANRIDRIIQEASVQNDPSACENSVRLLAADLASSPKESSLRALLGLYKKVGAGRILDALNYILGYEETLGHFGTVNLIMFNMTSVNICNAAHGFFDEVEREHYENMAHELRKLDDHDPNLPQAIAGYYKKAGVPSVCLLLSSRLKQAGHSDLAQTYTVKALDFYELAFGVYSHTRLNINRVAYYDFVSTPGFEQHARRYRGYVSPQDRDGQTADTFYVLGAVLDSYEGNMDSLVANMAKADEPATRKDKNQVVYDGSVFASAHDAGIRLVKNLTTGNKLSAQQSDRLKATSFYVDALKLTGGTTASAQLQNIEKQVVDKRDVGQMLKLVESYERERNYAKVVELYRKVVEVKPEVENYKKLISAQRSLKAYDDQIKTLIEMKGKFPKEGDYCLSSLMDAYRDNKQNDKVLETAEQRVKVHPQEASCHYGLASALRAVKRETDAAKAIKSGLEIDLDARSIERQRLELAGLYLALKQYDDAEKIARKILAQAPSEETERVARQLLEKIRKESERKAP